MVIKHLATHFKHAGKDMRSLAITLFGEQLGRVCSSQFVAANRGGGAPANTAIEKALNARETLRRAGKTAAVWLPKTTGSLSDELVLARVCPDEGVTPVLASSYPAEELAYLTEGDGILSRGIPINLAGGGISLTTHGARVEPLHLGLPKRALAESPLSSAEHDLADMLDKHVTGGAKGGSLEHLISLSRNLMPALLFAINHSKDSGVACVWQIDSRGHRTLPVNYEEHSGSRNPQDGDVHCHDYEMQLEEAMLYANRHNGLAMVMTCVDEHGYINLAKLNILLNGGYIPEILAAQTPEGLELYNQFREQREICLYNLSRTYYAFADAVLAGNPSEKFECQQKFIAAMAAVNRNRERLIEGVNLCLTAHDMSAHHLDPDKIAAAQRATWISQASHQRSYQYTLSEHHSLDGEPTFSIDAKSGDILVHLHTIDGEHITEHFDRHDATLALSAYLFASNDTTNSCITALLKEPSKHPETLDQLARSLLNLAQSRSKKPLVTPLVAAATVESHTMKDLELDEDTTASLALTTPHGHHSLRV